MSNEINWLINKSEVVEIVDGFEITRFAGKLPYHMTQKLQATAKAKAYKKQVIGKSVKYNLTTDQTDVITLIINDSGLVEMTREYLEMYG
jgi:hypothetical protein